MEENTSKAFVGTGGPLHPIPAGSGAGSALFVINLCASIAPVSTTGKNIPGLDNYRLYQVARVEDGRTRHRLRLGFFTSEAHADRVLTVVRQQYPTAFTACLCDEDRRFARGYLPDSALAAPAPAAKAAAPAPAVQQPAVAKKAAAPATPAVAPVATKASAPKTPVTEDVFEMTWEPDEATKAAAAAASSASLPKLRAMPADAGLDEFSWEGPAPAIAAALKKSDTGKHLALSSGSHKAIAPAAKPETSKFAPLDTGKHKPAAPVSKTSETGRFAPLDTGKHKATAPTAKTAEAGKFAPLDTGKHKAAAPAAKTPETGKFAPLDTGKHKATAPTAKTSETGKFKALAPKVEAPAKAAPAKVPAEPAAKVDLGSSMRMAALKLSLSDPPAAPAPQANIAPSEPFHVGKGVDIDDVDFSLLDEPRVDPLSHLAAAPVAKAPAPAVKTPAPAASKTPAAATKPAPAKATPPAKPVAPPVAKQPPAAAKPAPVAPVRALAGHPVPELDSTQTIRALTNEELNGIAGQEMWFAIQLAASEQPVNLDAMPHLDIFEAYRLYSVASAGSGKIIHSLRLGFFKEAVSAEAVGGYLKTFFANPSVLRVSVAEHGRFKDAPVKKPPPAAEPKNNVVEISDARAGRAVIPTVTVEVDSPKIDPSATGSFRMGQTGVFMNGATGSFKAGAPGTFKPGATGTFKPGATGAFKAGATGVHKALDPKAVAAKSSGAATKRSKSTSTSNTGKQKALKKSLAQELMDEAREVELSESGVRKMPTNGSILSRLFGKSK